MTRASHWLLPFAALLVPLTPVRGAKEADRPPAADLLKTLRPQHPRLYILDEDLPGIQKAAADDPLTHAWYERLQKEAGKMLDEPPVEHRLIGPRLLDQSRAALRRISTLAALYRLDGDRRKAERARREMLTAAAFPDWNPSHFLDTAEMTNALAIGYDWLFDFLSAEDRAAVRTALVEKGLKPGLRVYRKGGGWPEAHHNWNQVCNGGLAAGALAVADEEPALAAEVLARGRESLVRAMHSFAPDGGWDEGPGYWNYATHYNVFYLAALRSALGTDFGLTDMAGFADTGNFRIHSVGPLGLTFNYADAGAGAGTAPQMLWLARAFGRPDFARHERRLARARPDIFHLLWAGQPAADAPREEAPRDVLFRGVHVAFFRAAWDDDGAVYVGFKGGDNRANHSHLDLGTFVMDALGQRWALDLGPDDYNLPGYFGKQRWDYYRLRTEAHNTLTVDGENQNPNGVAPVIAYLSTPGRAFAVADLTGGYAPKARSVRRGIALLGRRQVLVQDELDAPRPVGVVWNFHTRAAIETHGDGATLTQGGAGLEARLLAPPGARFELVSDNAPPPQGQQPDVQDLVVRLPKTTGPVRIAVLLAPAEEGLPVPALEPLEKWVTAGRLPAGQK
jgi:hypothetical protein